MAYPEKEMSLLENPVWHALQTKHQHLAIRSADDQACRYPADVAPFVALAEPSKDALRQLASLLAQGETVWLIGDGFPAVEELYFEGTLECPQLLLPDEVVPGAHAAGCVQLSGASASEMVALTDLAYPGFFRPRTCEMGEYFGVRAEDGQLVAMGGERLMLEGYAEISGVCTNPLHRGKGLATNLIWKLVERHRRNGLKSFLHVVTTNRNAIKLYLDLGFQECGRVTLHQTRLRD